MERIDLGGVTALIGARGGKYPSGNSVLVEDEITLLVDPSLELAREGPAAVSRPVDVVVNSHAHEDHFVGNHRFPDAALVLHELDRPAMASIDALLAAYGMDAASTEGWANALVEQFHFRPRSDIRAVADGDCIDCGRTTARFLHTPGHTRGHMCVLFEPQGVVFTGDLDLTWFGPYYGDATASLEDTIRSLERLRDLEGVTAFVSFHEAGVVREDLRGTVERYMGVLWERERALVELVATPRTLDEIADACIVYRRRYDHIPWQHHVEKVMMRQHVERLVGLGELRLEGDRVARA